MRALGVCVLSLGLSCPVANATIANGTTGNGELFLNVVDATAKVSYALDMGVRMDDFFVRAQDNQGFQRFWLVDSPVWASFLALTNVQNLRWSVLAFDGTGGFGAGAQRLFTTVQQGHEGRWTSWTNLNFSNGTGAPFDRFFSAVNELPGHKPGGVVNIEQNGESVVSESDPGFSYYGEAGGGLTPTFNNTTTMNATNRVGDSSWFYYITRSSTSSIAFVLVDEFDNGNSAPAVGLGNDGYFGFVRVNNSDPGAPFYDPTSPFAGKYLLSFTLPAFDQRTTTSVREFAAGIGRTEYSGGFWMQSLAGAAAAAGSEGAAGWTRMLGAAAGDAAAIPLLQVSAVPEPGRVAMTLLGLAGVGLLVARRRHQRAAHRGA